MAPSIAISSQTAAEDTIEPVHRAMPRNSRDDAHERRTHERLRAMHEPSPPRRSVSRIPFGRQTDTIAPYGDEQHKAGTCRRPKRRPCVVVRHRSNEPNAGFAEPIRAASTVVEPYLVGAARGPTIPRHHGCDCQPAASARIDGKTKSHRRIAPPVKFNKLRGALLALERPRRRSEAHLPV